MSSAQTDTPKTLKSRGCTFSRQQLVILQEYLETRDLPSADILSNAGFLSEGPSGIFGRFKAFSKRLVIINDVFRHVTGKLVIPKEEFITVITKVHKDDSRKEHLNFEQTVKKLSETYTIGKRKFGMSKKLIEAVVKACNTGSCWKTKKSHRKKAYENIVKKFLRKSSTLTTSPTADTKSQVLKLKKLAKKRGRKTTSLAHHIIGPRSKTEEKILKQPTMPELIQMNEKPAPVLTSNPVTTNKPETITLGPFPVSLVKTSSGTSQYQLVLPIGSQPLNKSTTSTCKISTSGKVLNLPIIKMPTVNTSSTKIVVRPPVSGSTKVVVRPPVSGNTKVVVRPPVSGSISNVQTVDIQKLPVNLPFTTLLQNVANQASNKAVSSSSIWIPPVLPQNFHNITSSLPTKTVTSNVLAKPANMIINVPSGTTKMPALQCMIQQTTQKGNQQRKTTLSVVDQNEPLRKKAKTVKEMIENKTHSRTGSKIISKESDIENEDHFIITENDDSDVIMYDSDIVDINNNDNGIDNYTLCNNNTQCSTDVEDEEMQELIKTSGMYSSCLKVLTELPTEDFEFITDNITSDIYSEGSNPFRLPFHPMPEPPYLHLWYFPDEICQERNTFKRIMIVMKDIKIDMTRSMMQEHSAVERVKRKISYMETLIRRNKVYLDLCSTKYQKDMKKRQKYKARI